MAERTRGRRTALAGMAALALLAAGCGDGEEVGAKPDLPTEPPALWNPCDALDTDFVAKQFGSTTTKQAGTPTSPECRFVPEADSGEAVLTANYVLFPGTLEAAWDKMGQPDDADVRTPKIARADDARLVVDQTKEQLYVTGFVQNGDLIQQVDVADPAPYDAKRIVRAVEATLTVLSAHAADNDATQPSESPSKSPSPSSQG
ncbi:hypothetical protein JK386_07885 [Nocardioides sp. zg-536]|uniref:DUF3558 domain-containing protein n=1 Tax=Nocardioides faecalis TaxID=2803858 RepID=A0A939BVR5_9ACTN|nr:hypothetical protein [Nocardioides faecalis]MBM9459822.1 hypothetical protein [Nocardioides faecalis]QVI58936.1 hypothetical protein KG111_00590 [Nocardioides faecalis]